MAVETLDAAFVDPIASRQELVDAVESDPALLPTHGSSFFIHLSELCPVACLHCMYSSDLQRKSPVSSLDGDRLTQAIRLIDDSTSEKLNITGGGEPFLKYGSILRLLEAVRVPRIEIVTAGYWATSQTRARRILDRLAEMSSRNPVRPDVLLRLSIDRYHMEAPRPVLVSQYANVVRAWAGSRSPLSLGFRSIQPDRDRVDRQLAAELGAALQDVNDWNRRIVLDDGRSVPITFNVFRRSGKAARLADDHAGRTKSIADYYRPFETGDGRLVLATAVNDAIRGSYTPSAGVAITLNSDGTYWIFCGTSPDRRLPLGTLSFADSIAHFYRDPITRLLVDDGVWELADLVRVLDPAAHVRAVAKNDVAFLVEDLLAAPAVRLAVTLVAMARLAARGVLRLRPLTPAARLLGIPPDDLLERCRARIGAR